MGSGYDKGMSATAHALKDRYSTLAFCDTLYPDFKSTKQLLISPPVINYLTERERAYFPKPTLAEQNNRPQFHVV